MKEKFLRSNLKGFKKESKKILLNDSELHITNNIVGGTIAQKQLLYGLDGKLGIYFIFNDISVRKEGDFHLEFILYPIEYFYYL